VGCTFPTQAASWLPSAIAMHSGLHPGFLSWNAVPSNFSAHPPMNTQARTELPTPVFHPHPDSMSWPRTPMGVQDEQMKCK
jgi:hypothetical protein